MKKYLYATLILCAAIFISSCSMASGGGSGSSGDSGGTQSGGNTGSGSSAITVTADNAAQTIATLTGNSTVVLTGSVNSSQLAAIKDAINSGSRNVNLDLSQTTGLSSIGNRAFNNCRKLSGIALPSSVTSIGEWAFANCRALTQISIPSSVTSIEEGAFCYCSGLTQITIPSSVTSIGNIPFEGCSQLANINVDVSNSTYKSINGVLFNNAATSLITYPQGKSDTEYTIPSSVTSIGDTAFYGCSALTQISIPSSVTSIGENAFEDCTRVTQLTFEQPSSVTSIGRYALANCESLSSITIPNSVTSIRANTFVNCYTLSSITIPNSVTSIEACAFGDGFYLDSITFDDDSSWYITDDETKWNNKSGGELFNVTNPIPPTDDPNVYYPDTWFINDTLYLYKL